MKNIRAGKATSLMVNFLAEDSGSGMVLKQPPLWRREYCRLRVSRGFLRTAGRSLRKASPQGWPIR